ncbi:MAG TPA: chemotaxis protein CheW [Polyangiaceae bacterium]|jgi:purine-binding chemotaxis protein CheW
MNGDVLLIEAGARLCALPMAQVVETMRPLAVDPIANAPPFVAGLSLIRGRPVPVVLLEVLLAGKADSEPRRWVTLRVGSRMVALAVGRVVGTRRDSELELEGIPPLLSDAASEAIEALGRLDQQLLVLLKTARVVPEEIWGWIATLGESE